MRAGERLVEERLDRRLPAWAQRRDAQRTPELVDVVMTREVQQRVDVGDRHRFGPGADLHDVVARVHFALLQHTEVEARPSVRDEERRHAGLVHSDADAIAGDPWLGDLEQSGADAIPVADAHLVVTQTVDGEVLAELAEREVVPLHLALPVTVGVELVHVHRALLAAVSVQIALAVAVDVQAPDRARPVDRLLPDPREDGPAPPGDLTRQPHVDRDELRDRLRHRRTSSCRKHTSVGVHDQ